MSAANQAKHNETANNQEPDMLPANGVGVLPLTPEPGLAPARPRHQRHHGEGEGGQGEEEGGEGEEGGQLPPPRHDGVAPSHRRHRRDGDEGTYHGTKNAGFRL